jgi:hypothetical protein
MVSELSIEDMWKKIEEYGIDRKLLESTHPTDELLFQLYSAITKVAEEISTLNKIKTENS